MPHRRIRQRALRRVRQSSTTAKLVGVFLLGAFLFLPPLLRVFNAGGLLAGVPLLYVYLFLAWLGLVAVMALAIEGDPPAGFDE
jgi:hypothetical protein